MEDAFLVHHLAGVGEVVLDHQPDPLHDVAQDFLARHAPRAQVLLIDCLTLLKAILQTTPAEIGIPFPHEEDLGEERHEAYKLVPFQMSRVVAALHALVQARRERTLV